VATDIAERDKCAAMVDAAMAEFGRVDVLVNNAGIATAFPATRETPRSVPSLIDINLAGSYRAPRHAGG